MKKQELTDTEARVLNFIRDFITEFHRPPSSLEVNNQRCVESLEGKGLISRTPKVVKGIRLLEGSPFGISVPVFNLPWLKEKPRTEAR